MKFKRKITEIHHSSYDQTAI